MHVVNCLNKEHYRLNYWPKVSDRNSWLKWSHNLDTFVIRSWFDLLVKKPKKLNISISNLTKGSPLVMSVKHLWQIAYLRYILFYIILQCNNSHQIQSETTLVIKYGMKSLVLKMVSFPFSSWMKLICYTHFSCSYQQ